MNVRSTIATWVRALFVASFAVITAFAVVSQGANAQESRERSDRNDHDHDGPRRGLKNVVLVHGAWADGSSWSKVIPLLEARGLHVVAVQNSLTSLAADVVTTKQAIARLDGPVLLVGHSYGGAVITQAGDDPKVAGLVYVAAFAPDLGESVLDLLTANPTPIASELVLDQFGFISLTAKGIREDFAQDLSDTEQAVIIATQGPTSVAAGGTKITTAAWKFKPTWYAVAKRDRTISPDLERFFAQRMNATTIELSSSHVPMLSRPAEVAALIGRAAAAIQ
jgi:pimeloyl-ACP methyl ester carboxylesterase